MMARTFTFVFLVVMNAFATHVAVLETIGAPNTLDLSERQYLTDKLRQIAVSSLPSNKGYTIMTRENINAMLPPGKSIEECEGNCLVETGKNISADYVAQARVSRFDKMLTITVELYETASGKLMGSYTGESVNAKGLLGEIERKSKGLFSTIDLTPLLFPDDDKVMDKDGNVYKTVQIGNLIWMAENLNVKTKDSYCYGNNFENCRKYGRLYTWKAAQKACPAGWHLPSQYEFESLFTIIGKGDYSGIKLKSKSGWSENGNGLDVVGFSVLPAGYKSWEGPFFDLGKYAILMSSSEKDENRMHYLMLEYSSADLFLGEDGRKNSAGSVRCVKENLGEIKFKPEMIEQQFFPSFGSVSFGSQSYKTVKLGSQTWMAENLNINTKDSWCYENKSEKCSSYGRLYTWDAAKKACPVGWHLPSHVEFETLLYMAGGSDKAGLKLKSRYGWSFNGGKNGLDSYGFSVLPVGSFDFKRNEYGNEGFVSVFWTSSFFLNDSTVGPEHVDFSNFSDRTIYTFSNKNDRHPIRCIKD